MSKKESIAGLLGWQGKVQALRKRFFHFPTMGGYHNSCDRIWKIAFTFLKKKIGNDMFKADTAQIVDKIDTLKKFKVGQSF